MDRSQDFCQQSVPTAEGLCMEQSAADVQLHLRKEEAAVNA
jgi:hypothetical protein